MEEHTTTLVIQTLKRFALHFCDILNKMRKWTEMEWKSFQKTKDRSESKIY